MIVISENMHGMCMDPLGESAPVEYPADEVLVI